MPKTPCKVVPAIRRRLRDIAFDLVERIRGHSCHSWLINLCACELNADLRGDSKSNLLNWFNILSLDAPVVAVVWQAFFTELFDVKISMSARIILGLTIWLAYVADRWMDGRMLPGGTAVTLRHQFAQRNARAIAISWGLVFVGNFMLALIGLSTREFFFGLVLAVATVGYLYGVHLRSVRDVVASSKELLVALLFSAGTLVFVAAEIEGGYSDLLVCGGMFFGLCLANCLLVSSWERSDDAQQAQPSMAIRWNITPVVARWFAASGLLLMVVLFFVHRQSEIGWTAMAAGAGFLLLVILELSARRIALNKRRVLADIALLSPFLIMAWMRNEL